MYWSWVEDRQKNKDGGYDTPMPPSPTVKKIDYVTINKGAQYEENIRLANEEIYNFRKYGGDVEYGQFREEWVAALSEDVQRERESVFALDIESELEQLCQEDFAKIHTKLDENGDENEAD